MPTPETSRGLVSTGHSAKMFRGSILLEAPDLVEFDGQRVGVHLVGVAGRFQQLLTEQGAQPDGRASGRGAPVPAVEGRCHRWRGLWREKPL